MLDGALQSLVDELAARLHRSVAVDDPSIRLLAASRHFADEDAVRVGSILNRCVDPAIVAELHSKGVAGWQEPGVVRLSGAAPRLCAPVRCDGMLLGYLWLIDRDGRFSEQEVSAAAETAAAAGAVLYRRLLLTERAKARAQSLMHELVSADAAVRAQAVADLRAEQLVTDEPVHFTVLSVTRRSTGSSAPEQEIAFEAAVEEGARLVSDDGALTVAYRSRGWLLLVQRRPPARTLVTAVTTRIAERFRQRAAEGGQLVFGLGGTVTRLEAIVTSYQQALLATRAALLLPGIGELARWGELGPYELLLKLPVEEVLSTAPLRALTALEDQDGQRILLTTLTAFLDRAGSVARTTEELHIHRATLYQRLKRIEQITGCSLEDGDDRLLLHLGLKLRTLSAAYRDKLGEP